MMWFWVDLVCDGGFLRTLESPQAELIGALRCLREVHGWVLSSTCWHLVVNDGGWAKTVSKIGGKNGGQSWRERQVGKVGKGSG